MVESLCKRRVKSATGLELLDRCPETKAVARRSRGLTQIRGKRILPLRSSEIRGCISLVAAGRAGFSAFFRGSD